MNSLSLNQRSSLLNALKGLADPETLWELTEKITDKQVKLLWALILNKESISLKNTVENMTDYYSLKENVTSNQ